MVRLWEDVLRTLPDVLESVPDDLREFIESDATSWTERAEDDEDLIAEMWYGDHSLDLGYLRNPPRIRWWRTIIDGVDIVTVDWRNRHLDNDADTAFAGPGSGRLAITTEDFIDAVRDLDRNLMDAMDQRIAALRMHEVPPGIDLDIELLRKEHHAHTAWFAAAVGRRTTDWDEVRSGAARRRARWST